MKEPTLTHEERIELIPALADVARAYYEEPEKINYQAGICYNLMEVARVKWSYQKVKKLMKELGFTESYFENSYVAHVRDKSFEEWEERAYMCLFLSEYLYDTLEQELIVKQEASKSIVQKVKDKWNEFCEHLHQYYQHRELLIRKVKSS